MHNELDFAEMQPPRPYVDGTRSSRMDCVSLEVKKKVAFPNEGKAI